MVGARVREIELLWHHCAPAVEEVRSDRNDDTRSMEFEARPRNAVGLAVRGDGCMIRQNCTLGVRRINDPGAAPTLEAGVELGAGAVILGRIRIGYGAKIGANAVVLIDVPAGAFALGVPATIRS